MKILDNIKKEKGNNQSSVDNLKTLFEWKIKKSAQQSMVLKIGVIVFLLIITIILFLQKNLFGGVAILMAIFLIFMMQTNNKEKITYAILGGGIKIGKETFPWKNLKSFWIFENIPQLYIKTKGSIVQNISLPIEEKNIGKIREILLNFLAEKETTISLSEIIFKKLGF